MRAIVVDEFGPTGSVARRARSPSAGARPRRGAGRDRTPRRSITSIMLVVGGTYQFLPPLPVHSRARDRPASSRRSARA